MDTARESEYVAFIVGTSNIRVLIADKSNLTALEVLVRSNCRRRSSRTIRDG